MQFYYNQIHVKAYKFAMQVHRRSHQCVIKRITLLCTYQHTQIIYTSQGCQTKPKTIGQEVCKTSLQPPQQPLVPPSSASGALRCDCCWLEHFLRPTKTRIPSKPMETPPGEAGWMLKLKAMRPTWVCLLSSTTPACTTRF